MQYTLAENLAAAGSFWGLVFLGVVVALLLTKGGRP